jgi:hypothetical protein
MGALAAVPGPRAPRRVVRTTLLELVTVVSRHVDDEQRVVQIVCELLQHGQARLMGSFHGVPLEILCQAAAAPAPSR